MTRESDPRPMPANILRDYRKEIDFPVLWENIRFETDESGTQVMRRAYGDEPLLSLVKMIADRFGCPEITIEGNYWNAGQTCSLLDFPLFFKGPPRCLISDIMRVPDLGGYHMLRQVLAEFMEPAWQAFWRGVSQFGEDVMNCTYSYFKVITRVLGPDQVCWILAQSKRYMLQHQCFTRKWNADDWFLTLSDLQFTEDWLSIPANTRKQISPRPSNDITRVIALWNESSVGLDQRFFSEAANVMSALTGGRSETYLYRREILKMIRSLIQPSLIQPA